MAATLAGKLARYVNPNLLPLVAEELGAHNLARRPASGPARALDGRPTRLSRASFAVSPQVTLRHREMPWSHDPPVKSA